jgi:prevent-host-death family protein
MVKVNILEAKNRLSKLIHAAVAGEEVIIANRGEPVARLVPALGPQSRPDLGSARAILDWLAAKPLPPYLRRTAKEIDAAIAEERTGWD